MNKKSSSKNERTGPPPEAEKVQVWHKRSRLLRSHTSTQGNLHGPHQTIWNCRMANPNKSKGCSILSGIHLLLQKIHRRLLKHCPPTHRPYQEKPRMEIVTLLPKSLQPAERRIFQATHPLPPQPQQTLCHRHQCLQRCIWRNSPPNRLKWRMASLLIPFTIFLPCRKKLQHLRQRTPCSHMRSENMETLWCRSASHHQLCTAFIDTSK